MKLPVKQSKTKMRQKVRQEEHTDLENSVSIRNLLFDVKEFYSDEEGSESENIPNSLNSKSLNLTPFEKEKIDQLSKAMSIFEDERNLPLLYTSDDFEAAIALPANYARRIVRLCKRIDEFQMIKREDQHSILKDFYVEFLKVRFSFTYNAKRQSMLFLAVNLKGKLQFRNFHILI